MNISSIYCCGCRDDVKARLTDGAEIYPHRPDLSKLPFWKCDECENYVGCHHKTKDRTRPLGCIPTDALRNVRKKLHAALDPLWRSGQWSRKELYKELSNRLGREFHAAETRSIDEVNEALAALAMIEKDHE